MAVTQLAEGMVLQEDVLTSDGLILLRSGRRLTLPIIEKLRTYRTSAVSLRPVRVRHATAGAATPELVAMGAS